MLKTSIFGKKPWWKCSKWPFSAKNRGFHPQNGHFPIVHRGARFQNDHFPVANHDAMLQNDGFHGCHFGAIPENAHIFITQVIPP